MLLLVLILCLFQHILSEATLMKQWLVGLWGLLVFPCVSIQVYAGSEIEMLFDMLLENGTVSAAQYDRLMAELKQTQQPSSGTKGVTDTQVDKVARSAPAVQVNKGGLTIKSDDDAFTTQLGGRLQIDAASYNGGFEQGDGTEVRRAYLTLQGQLYHDWGYRFQYNFANTGANGKGILDAYVDYKGLDNVTFRVGHFKAPFTLHEAVSDNFTTFTERAMNAAFSPGRKIGIMASHANNAKTWAVGAFGESVSSQGKANNEGWGLSGRVTASPINERVNDQDHVLHIGLGANYRHVNSSETVQFKQQAETHVSGINIVDTGSISDAESVLKLSAEIAGVWGPFAAQAEYISAEVDRKAFDDVIFDGWYVETSYFLTGESRQYDKGRFGRPKPLANAGHSGVGAWQLALRYSEIDLTDGLINGGEAEALTLGLNWFPNPTLRFSANYIDVLDIEGGPQDNQSPRVFQVRSQWAF